MRERDLTTRARRARGESTGVEHVISIDRRHAAMPTNAVERARAAKPLVYVAAALELRHPCSRRLFLP